MINYDRINKKYTGDIANSFSGIQVSSTDLYISDVRTAGKWVLNLGGVS